MPGNVPPDPWKDPAAYLVWYHDQVAELAAAGLLVELNAFIDVQRPIIDRLRG